MTSYAYDFMNVQKFHDLGIEGQGIKVAVMDSGVQQHVDLNIKGGFNAFDDSIPYDSEIKASHGTAVAGIIGMRGGGIAPACDLYAIRVDDSTGSNAGNRLSEHVIGIDWAIDNDIDVIVCSFSSVNDTKERRDAFKRAHEAGIAIFCSANNRQGSEPLTVDTMRYPARYPFVVTSANIDSDKKRYSSSSVGPQINFSSGGVNVTTTTSDNSSSVSNKYRTGTGTSYANPAVAGVYVLFKQMYPNDSRDKILQRMYVSAENLGNPWEYGAGIPRFYNGHKNILIWSRR